MDMLRNDKPKRTAGERVTLKSNALTRNGKELDRAWELTGREHAKYLGVQCNAYRMNLCVRDEVIGEPCPHAQIHHPRKSCREYKHRLCIYCGTREPTDTNYVSCVRVYERRKLTYTARP